MSFGRKLLELAGIYGLARRDRSLSDYYCGYGYIRIDGLMRNVVGLKSDHFRVVLVSDWNHRSPARTAGKMGLTQNPAVFLEPG